MKAVFIFQEFQSKLFDYLRRHESVEEFRYEKDNEIFNAVDWLRRHQHPLGYWGYESAPDTAMAIWAIHTWSPENVLWRIRLGENIEIECGFQKAVDWLKQHQDDNGSWESNLWDTAITLQVLVRIGYLEEDWVRKGINWVIKQRSNGWMSHEGIVRLHHTAQALNLFNLVNVDEEIKAQCKKLIIDELSKCNFKEDTPSPYKIGQVIDSLLNSGFQFNLPIISQAADYLKRYLAQTSVDNSSFLNFCLAFIGLRYLYKDSIEVKWCQNVSEQLFYSSHFRRDKSWYREAIKTSWGLLCLKSVTQIKKVNTYAAKLYSDLTKIGDYALEQFKSDHKRLVRLILLLSISIILATIFSIGWASIFILIDKGIMPNLETYKSVIGGIFLGLVSVTWSFVILLLQRLLKK